MIIRKKEVKLIDFEGLQIADYTNAQNLSSSLAVVTVPPGVNHKLAWSKKSDKYYYVLSGVVDFTVVTETSQLSEGDLCIIKQGDKFKYKNSSQNMTILLLIHSPQFNLNDEVPVHAQGVQGRGRREIKR